MESIKETLQSVLERLETTKRNVSLDDPEMILRKVFPKRDLAHLRFHYFKNGIFSMRVDSSTWLYHFSLQKEDLLVKLRKKSKAIQELRFSLGEIK